MRESPESCPSLGYTALHLRRGLHQSTYCKVHCSSMQAVAAGVESRPRAQVGYSHFKFILCVQKLQILLFHFLDSLYFCLLFFFLIGKVSQILMREKMAQNGQKCIKSFFLGKNCISRGPLQKLKKGPRSELYLLVVSKTGAHPFI